MCIEAHDRAALERLLRYCARPPFSMERLRKEGSKLVYRCAKQRSEPTSDKRGAKADELHLTPLELIDRIAALVPPPRTHRHRYFGVLAPNLPLRAAVTALATPAQPPRAGRRSARGVRAWCGTDEQRAAIPERAGAAQACSALPVAVLIARIYEVFPSCVRCVAGICASSRSLRTALTSGTSWTTSGRFRATPHLPARGPPLWDD